MTVYCEPVMSLMTRALQLSGTDAKCRYAVARWHPKRPAYCSAERYSTHRFQYSACVVMCIFLSSVSMVVTPFNPWLMGTNVLFCTADEAGACPPPRKAEPPPKRRNLLLGLCISAFLHAFLHFCMFFRPVTGGARAGWARNVASRAAGGACDRAAQSARSPWWRADRSNRANGGCTLLGVGQTSSDVPRRAASGRATSQLFVKPLFCE